MHELSIARQILESVQNHVEARPKETVLRAKLEIGELTGIEPEQLQFYYDSIKKQTALKNSTLEIEIVPALVKCRRCNYEGPPKYLPGALSGSPIPTIQCAKCGKIAEVIRGYKYAVKSLQLGDSESAQTVVSQEATRPSNTL